MSGAFTFDHPPYSPHAAGVDLGSVMVMPTGGNIVYLRSTGPADYDPPALSGRIVSTLASALGQCRANKGDTVIVLPGHSESVTAGTALSALVAGTNIIGFGRGSDMPTFRWTNTAGQWALDDANVLIRGLRLRLEGANGITKAILITAADVCIRECDIEVASGATAKSTIAIEVGTGGARAEVVGCRLRGTATHNVTDGIKVVAAVDGVRIVGNDMVFSATAGNGLVHFTAAATNTVVAKNHMYNTHTSSTACVAYDNVAVDGLLAYNVMATLNDGTATAQGATFGAGALIRCVENYSVDEPKKSGVLTPAAVAT
jgi:hypothetical protein